MKLFGPRTTVAQPAVPREPMTSDPDVLATIWAKWLAVQPMQDQQHLAWRDRNGDLDAFAGHVAAEPVRKLHFLLDDSSLEPVVRELANGLLAGDLEARVPAGLSHAAEESDLERSLTTAAVREVVADRMSPAGADAVALVIGLLLGTEFGLHDDAPRRVLVARGAVFVALRDLGLPIHTWEARLTELGCGASRVFEPGAPVA
jgi:hypothetical protein